MTFTQRRRSGSRSAATRGERITLDDVEKAYETKSGAALRSAVEL